MTVKNNREEGNNQGKFQDASPATIQTSANKTDANRRGGVKRKVKAVKLSHSVTAGQRK